MGVMTMPDYKEMYLTMVRETERAIDILTAAQRHCEELYIHAEEPKLTLLETERPDKLDSASN
ncbi:MAG TPA: hypothetical protein PK597_00590 [Oscillospiraceae bacterium]|nr:hypothetical protein [Oscillospiraceae bacterium]